MRLRSTYLIDRYEVNSMLDGVSLEVPLMYGDDFVILRVNSYGIYVWISVPLLSVCHLFLELRRGVVFSHLRHCLSLRCLAMCIRARLHVVPATTNLWVFLGLVSSVGLILWSGTN